MRRRTGCRAPALPSDRHDGTCIHCGLSTALGRQWFRRCVAQDPGYSGRRRNDALDYPRPHLHSSHICCRRILIASIREGRQGHHDGFHLRSWGPYRRTHPWSAHKCRHRRRPRIMNHQRLVPLGLLTCAIILLSGCNVGPKYVRPNVMAPPVYRGADGAEVTSDAKSSLGDEQWASVYREPELQELIRKALANNYDVRIAAKRILEQEAQVRITRSLEFPLVNIGGTGIGATLPNTLGTQFPNPL